MSNRNSYLVLSLSEKLRTNLSILAENIKNSMATIDSGNGNLDFNPMEPENIHMTFFFTGMLLHKLSSLQLKKWYDMVSLIIKGTVREGKQDEPLMIKYTGLDLFPPTKSNLIIAKFRVDPLLDKMYQKIVSASIPLLGEETSKLNVEWIPHCTLGKLRAPKTIVADIGNKVIKDMVGKDIKLEDAHIDGLLMCGERPKQIWIDWDNYFKF